MTNEAKTESFEEWALLELMGHRRLAGRVSEQRIGGQAFIRIDVPDTDAGKGFTQFYNGPAIYAITPTTEDVARAIAEGIRAEPITRYDLPHTALMAPGGLAPLGGRDDDDDDEAPF